MKELLEKAHQAVFAGYSASADQFSDDSAWAIFLRGKLTEAHTLIQGLKKAVEEPLSPLDKVERAVEMLASANNLLQDAKREAGDRQKMHRRAQAAEANAARAEQSAEHWKGNAEFWHRNLTREFYGVTTPQTPRLDHIAHLEESLCELQKRYDADMKMMNERLLDQHTGLMNRLQEKTLREGFVPVELAAEALDHIRKGYGFDAALQTARTGQEIVDDLEKAIKSKLSAP